MRLDTFFVEKVWGVESLPPLFPEAEGKRIGEIWFDPPAELPDLLVKYIFTSQKLSVQCHPSDTQTTKAGTGKHGKEECWLVIAAEEGAQVGIGFTQNIDSDTIRAAAIDGSIETLLAWHDVKVGDFFSIPANTVHAIGGGVTIIEIQQNSDITYRLYDYGRARELHLKEGVAVASGKKFDPEARRYVPETSSLTLIDGPHFRVDQIAGSPRAKQRQAYPANLLVIPRAGEIEVGASTIRPGECALAANIDEVGFQAESVCLVTTVREEGARA